jgi:hypothetical protein
MPRPVKRRTVVSYRRDVEHLTRLRSALKLDSSKLGNSLVEQTCQDIDTLLNRLVDCIRKVEANDT